MDKDIALIAGVIAYCITVTVRIPVEEIMWGLMASIVSYTVALIF